MELKTQLEQLFERIEATKDKVLTEEATKTAFILPFIQLLGYDVFNPAEVIPEYVADIGTKKGEKVDYLIMKGDEPIILIECKHWQAKTEAHNSQLHRYYTNVDARFGVITNGIVYDFYTDLENPNKMDDKPFLTVNLEHLKEATVKELEKFKKSDFELTNILDSAESLKYVKSIRIEFENEIKEVSDELTKLLVSRFFSKPITASRLEMFKGYAQRAVNASINDIINAKLKAALNMNESEQTEVDTVQENESAQEHEDSKIVTTDEEFEAFHIVKSILREILNGDDIAAKDTQSYFGVLYQNNVRKPLCRFHFNTANKYIELFNEGKDNAKKMSVDSIEDIYNFRDELLETAKGYLD